jgi:hypothetical protein
MRLNVRRSRYDPVSFALPRPMRCVDLHVDSDILLTEHVINILPVLSGGLCTLNLRCGYAVSFYGGHEQGLCDALITVVIHNFGDKYLVRVLIPNESGYIVTAAIGRISHEKLPVGFSIRQYAVVKPHFGRIKDSALAFNRFALILREPRGHIAVSLK